MAQVREERSPRFHRPLFVLAASALVLLAGCSRRDADLDVSTKEIDLGSSLSTSTFTVKNRATDLLLTKGVVPLDYEIHTDVTWLAVTPSSGTLEGGQKRTHTVDLNRSALGDGAHTGLILVTSNGGDASILLKFVNGAPPPATCTAAPSSPSGGTPSTGATGVAITADLAWSGGASQCPGLTASYDIRFGTTSPPPLAHDNGTSKSWDPGTLLNSTTYYWQIVAHDANGSTTGPIWSFTTVAAAPPPTTCTTPPSAPSGATPASGATGVAVSADLSWSGGASQCPGLTATYDVRFGTSSPPPLDHDNGTSKSWDPGTLLNATTYYWQIVAKDANGSTAGPIWTFTTVDPAPPPPCTTPPSAACTPTPTDARTGVNENANLAWGCGESSCGLAVTYDVYFGTNPTPGPAELLGNTANKTWDLAPLAKNTVYYWQVVTKDANGSTPGPIWSFRTRT